jgi:hypothetical protein
LKNKQRPSIFRTLIVDPAATLSAFTAIGLWIVSLIDPTVQSCLRLVTIASTVVLLWRFIHVFTLFNVGVETTAVIQNILIYRIYDQVFFHTPSKIAELKPIAYSPKTQMLINLFAIRKSPFW